MGEVRGQCCGDGKTFPAGVLHLLAESWPTCWSASAQSRTRRRTGAGGCGAGQRASRRFRKRTACGRAPTAFFRRRWEKLAHTDPGFDRRNYELCILCELNTALARAKSGSKTKKLFG
jgi:hypothetical protein